MEGLELIQELAASLQEMCDLHGKEGACLCGSELDPALSRHIAAYQRARAILGQVEGVE